MSTLAPHLRTPMQKIVGVDQMEQFLKTTAAASFWTEDPGAFHASFAKREFSRFFVTYCSYDTPARLRFESSEEIGEQFVIAGGGAAEVARQRNPINESHSYLLPSRAPYVLDFGAGLRQLFVRIPLPVLESTFVALAGVLPRGSLRFSSDSITGDAFMRLRRILMFLTEEASQSDDKSVAVKEIEDAFLAQFLLVNLPSTSSLLLGSPRAATPKQIYLVEDYIEANWNKPITVESIARSTGVSARSIYATFKQHRGYGPKAFLRQMRLNKARELLRGGHMEVAEVAKACGFANAGHFARYYRMAFGESPSQARR